VTARPPDTYDAQNIQVLEGLEPVRKRPGMYIGGVDARGLHHLVWEIVDNSIDEVIAGYARTIEVTLSADRRVVTVRDDGRGIPVDPHPKDKKSALEVILTTLHAGGKFDRDSYQHSGGLHGVGSSVVAALSEEMVATVRREGVEWELRLARGVPTTKLTKKGNTNRRGTEITFKADGEIFPDPLFSAETIRERLESKSYLHRGLKVMYHDLSWREPDAPAQSRPQGRHEEFFHQGGIADYLVKWLDERNQPRVHPAPFTLHREGRQGELRLELALQWTEATDESLRSYVNGIPTTSGGTHERGLRDGLAKAVRNYLCTGDHLPKGVSLTAEDIREGLVGILSIYVAEPQFQGQTKDRLNNTEVAPQVDAVVRPALEKWLLENSSSALSIVGRMVLAAKAREASRAAAAQVTRKSAVSHRLNLPGKLADCASTDPANSELFIVEGDSAGGSAKQGRDRKTQAILPLRGKVLNSEQASASKVVANKELQDIVSALGCGMGKELDLSKLRYHKICLLMDADSDGHHISTLLLTFFYRHLTPLVLNGYVYLAQPPLYKISHGKQTHWVLDDGDKEKVLRSLPTNAKPEITRFKGLGEMMPEVLRDTTLDPRRRNLLRVSVADQSETDKVVNGLLGKDPQARFRFIMERANEADELDV
jgi:DNA gyrase subunit B/topoisomerase-4 subunit B